MVLSSLLLVERGAPFNSGDVIKISNSMILGREGVGWVPDVVFNNAFISRKHVRIFKGDNGFYVEDLDSKHGTYLNNERLNSYRPSLLKPNDRISLANEMVVLSFSNHSIEETLDLSPFINISEEVKNTVSMIDSDKLTITINHIPYSLSDKEFKFLELLVENQEEFVSKEEIKRRVWPERFITTEKVPDVSSEEINAIVYRIRKKKIEHMSIETVRGKGYILGFKR
ncbi:winged helix-turn-helix domain-containing protein [Cytobacillus suaedae]|nr:winged helix-turn-helix domain-containing protein [Cytobacillus suaedae]